MVAFSQQNRSRGVNIFLLFHAVVLLAILYEINDFGNHVAHHLYKRRAYRRMAADSRCLPEPIDEDSVNVVTVSCNGIVATCLEARGNATAFVLGQSFNSFIESRYLYQLLTLESRVAQVMVILLLMWTIHVAGKYYIAVYQTNHIALPINYARPSASHAFLHGVMDLLSGESRIAARQPALLSSSDPVYGSIERHARARVQELPEDE